MTNRIDQTTGSSASAERPGKGDGNADPGLEQAVDRAVPDAEKLPGRGAENPITQQVEKAVDERQPRPGPSTLQGNDQPS
ncbi:hypothetical protein [Geminicoccus flavidas]|uniref:hypothetical protein n=1 Tax=Geminicoccus flavidas TaxID=2506407 RepID=UPI001359136B|nr:hypothetical protein [Geminicoccus flavidas]